MRKDTGLVFETRYLDHVIQPGHPESPARLAAVMDRLEESGLRAQMQALDPVADPFPAIAAIHTRGHVDGIRALPGTGTVAALAAAGALAAVDAVCRGEVRNAFCALRPPGHHAHNMGAEEGFCFYNNVSIAARHAQRAHGCGRILIIDWDYHHGNATEETFYEDASVLFFSTHKWMAYPGTGDPARRGAGEGYGYTINADLGAGAVDKDILAAWDEHFLPAAQAFRPDLVLISAGFDSRKEDTLGDFRLSDDAFRRMTRMAMDLAASTAGGRLVSLLEGGYNPRGLALGVAAHVEELLA